MSDILQEVDERSRLAGTNRFELLLFQLGKDTQVGTREIYGINVFKVREALVMPSITPMPGAPEYVMGVANIRGQIIPVVDLPAVVGCQPDGLNILLVTEYERSIQGFAVENVEEIRRLEWKRVISAEVSAAGGMVTSLARLDEDDEKGRLALVLDVEQILRLALPARFKGGNEVTQHHDIQIPQGSVILYADDSGVARSQIEKTLTHLGLPFVGTKTGKEAWERLQVFAKDAKAANIPIRQKIALVLTDLEMPEMDGFTLARQMKENETLKDIPVVIHSSLSGTANESHANSVGADGYVAKFSPDELARAIVKVL
ncbi:chemotaxis protein [Acidithiobacillus thiooxidans]|uniref:Chemotaxis protein CheV n=1 Tax=Acidithiobacillus thiooxidans TaxID=930 RepID=A0A1C2IAE4_ACITH|nr:chemotaxis protein [Acidithiobacillus thiooxidans]OCX72979.1 chemotaxis protein CheV [Acidithiobacillus thiooxidans]OCX78415.1 chemotaxis protein CheV [Acidithiobacillus thiooxidans]